MDSPWPAAAKTYAALLRKLALRTSSRRSSARAIVIGLPDRLDSTVAPASAASALGGTGTHMSSQISTWSRRSGRSVAAKIRSGPSGTSHAGDADRRTREVVAGGEVAALVELAVVRQVGLRGDAEDPARLDHDRAVEQPGAVHAAGRPRRSPAAGRPRPRRRWRSRSCDGVEQGVLEEEVLDGVAAQAELGEDRDGHAVVVALARLRQHGRERSRPGRPAPPASCTRRTRAKPLRVRRGELHALPSLGSQTRGRRDDPRRTLAA